MYVYDENFNFSQVFNDFIGFAGPLLLNKLIRFLQQGFQCLIIFFFNL
jgi:hypothetical protein